MKQALRARFYLLVLLFRIIDRVRWRLEVRAFVIGNGRSISAISVRNALVLRPRVAASRNKWIVSCGWRLRRYSPVTLLTRRVNESLRISKRINIQIFMLRLP